MIKGPLRVLLLTCALLLLGTCGSTDADRRPFGPPANDCGAGKGNADRATPVVCVDKTAAGVTVDPPTIEAWDRGRAVGLANHIHWVTRSGGGELSIRMKDEGCVEPPVCRNGVCRAKAKDMPVKQQKQCSYAVTLDGVELDPDVIIVDCCT